MKFHIPGNKQKLKMIVSNKLITRYKLFVALSVIYVSTFLYMARHCGKHYELHYKEFVQVTNIKRENSIAGDDENKQVESFAVNNDSLPNNKFGAGDTPKKYFLTAVVLLSNDLNQKLEFDTNVSISDLKTETIKTMFVQWMRYMRFAGVEHIYLYNRNPANVDTLQDLMTSKCYNGFLTMNDWSNVLGKYVDAKISANNNALKNYRTSSEWMITINLNEYPFSPVDTKQRFLSQFVRKQSAMKPNIAEFSLQNYRFWKQFEAQEVIKNTQMNTVRKKTSKNETLLVEKFKYRTADISDHLDIPIFKTDCTKKCGITHNQLDSVCGSSQNVNPRHIRVNRYTLPQLENSQELQKDVTSLSAKSVHDTSIVHVLLKMKLSNADSC